MNNANRFGVNLMASMGQKVMIWSFFIHGTVPHLSKYLSDYSIVSVTDRDMRLNISSSSCCKDSSDRLQPAMNTIEMKLIFKMNGMSELPTGFTVLAFHVLSSTGVI